MGKNEMIFRPTHKVHLPHRYLKNTALATLCVQLSKYITPIELQRSVQQKFSITTPDSDNSDNNDNDKSTAVMYKILMEGRHRRY